MEKRSKSVIWALGLLMSIAIVITYLVPGAQKFQQPELARIIFFHVPCAILGTLFLITASWFSYQYLKKRAIEWDIRCAACLEISWLLSILTLTTGMVFAKVQWGTWWQWDPRQTSYLIFFFILSAGLLLRQSVPEDHRCATTSAVYTIASLIPTMFLVFVFPRLPHIQSFHPSETLLKGELDLSYSWVLRSVSALLLWTLITLYRLRVRAELLEKKLEDYYANRNMETDRYATPVNGVDRILSLSAKD